MAFCTKCGTKVDDRFCPNCGFDVGGSLAATAGATVVTPVAAPVTPAPVSDSTLSGKPAATSPEATKETIKQLYALRAGISYIACEADKYKAEQRKRKEEKKKTLSVIKGFDKLGTTPRLSVDEISRKISALDEQQNKILEETQKTANTLLKASHWTIGIGVLLIAFVFSFYLGYDPGLLVTALLIGIFIVIAIYMVICFAGHKVCNIGQDKIRSTEKECETLKLLLAHEKSIESFETEHSEFVGKEGAERFLAILEDEIFTADRAWKNRVNSLLSELANTFAQTLDLRDWENLDLVIFYMETGRAETIKEALQQVDRQRQNNALVDAIGLATKQINATISNGMLALGMTVVGCSMLLTGMVKGAKQALGTANSLYGVSAGGADAPCFLGEASDEEIATAMEAKASVSSHDLMADISPENASL